MDLNGLGEKIEILNKEASDLQAEDLPSDQVQIKDWKTLQQYYNVRLKLHCNVPKRFWG